MYPEQVERIAKNMVSQITVDLSQEQIGKDETEEQFSIKLFDKFLAGDELLLTNAEISYCIDKAITSTAVNNLLAKGLINSIENENNETIYFLTEKGKRVREVLLH